MNRKRIRPSKSNPGGIILFINFFIKPLKKLINVIAYCLLAFLVISCETGTKKAPLKADVISEMNESCFDLNNYWEIREFKTIIDQDKNKRIENYIRNKITPKSIVIRVMVAGPSGYFYLPPKYNPSVKMQKKYIFQESHGDSTMIITSWCFYLIKNKNNKARLIFYADSAIFDRVLNVNFNNFNALLNPGIKDSLKLIKTKGYSTYITTWSEGFSQTGYMDGFFSLNQYDSSSGMKSNYQKSLFCLYYFIKTNYLYPEKLIDNAYFL